MGTRIDGLTLALVAAPALIWPGVAAAKFAPPEGKALRYVVTDEREEGRFASERTIVFTKTDQGYLAEVTIVSNGPVAGARGVVSMAGRAMAALTGRTIRYHLNKDGVVVQVEDQDALMKVVVDGLGKMGGGGAGSPARSGTALSVAGVIGSLKPDGQRMLLASMLTPVIAGVAESSGVPGERPVALPAGSWMGQQAELKGTEKTTRDAAGRIVIDTVTEGPAPGALAGGIAADMAPRGTPMMRIVQHREIDPATGLVMVNTRSTESWLSTAAGERQTIRSSSTLTIG